MSYEDELKKNIEEGIFSKNKSTEEMIAKSIVRLIQDKAKEAKVSPKSIVNYIQDKIRWGYNAK